MVAKRFLFLLVFAVIYFGCSNDNQVTSPNPSTTGQVLLKIDRSNAPEGIVLVTATLSRENFPLITASLNLLSDTTADLSLSSIPVGEWLLTVEAKDSVDEVKYRGEANVTIMESMITQVSLTLSPTSTGTGLGSIYIFVNWRQTQLWVDFINNPVFSNSGNYWDYYDVRGPKIIVDNNQFKMWYSGMANGGVSHIGYATSMDGINWVRVTSNPVLAPGSYGLWDETSVSPGAVIKENTGYKMYYTGYSSQSGNWHIGLATSVDGVSWTKHPSPVIWGTTGWERQVIASSILKIDGVYHLYFVGRNYPSYKIGLALSTDGINWTKYSGNPILEPDMLWEGSGIYSPGVVLDGQTYKMVYMNYVGSSGTAFGLATSIDGKNWTKQASNPIFTRELSTNGWASMDIAYPNYVKYSDEHRIYYCGFNSSHMDKYKIGFLGKP
jgi:predicted GH43/DUF377 family glycosyl hydrolase